MLKLILLLLSLVAAGRAESSSLVCPELTPADSICFDARDGFDFFDGCNRVRCLSGGGAASTRRQCPPPRTAGERSRCRSHAFAVFDRMPPRACPNASPQAICASSSRSKARAGFRFTDGCNQIACAADGSVAGVTRRSCPEGSPDSPFCQFIEQLNVDMANEEEGEGADGSMRRRRRSGQEFTCPQLAPSQICGRSTNGFSYSDGCNTVTCHADGTGQSTFKACPTPEESAVGAAAGAAIAYCEDAERTMQAKMLRSSLRSRCLQPDRVCVGEAVGRRLAFNDGCNRCICTAIGEASCAQRSCPKVLMGDQEFENYCEQRGSGIH